MMSFQQEGVKAQESWRPKPIWARHLWHPTHHACNERRAGLVPFPFFLFFFSNKLYMRWTSGTDNAVRTMILREVVVAHEAPSGVGGTGVVCPKQPIYPFNAATNLLHGPHENIHLRQPPASLTQTHRTG